MSARQLGDRIGLTDSGVLEMERNEAEDAITLRSLQRAAQGLGCTLVYALVPDQSLEAHLRAEAERTAKALIGSVDRSMTLEAQGLDQRARADEIKDLTEELVRSPREVWNHASRSA